MPSSSTELIDVLPVAVVVASAAGDILEVNDAAVELLGRAREACVGTDLAKFDAHDRARIRRDDGTHRDVARQQRTLTDGRVVSVLHDVTATTAEVDALCESEDQLKFIANTVPALLAFLDTEARYVWVNESYRVWFGQSPESIRGRHVREVLGEAPWEQVRQRIDRVLAGETVVFDNRAFYKHGPPREVHVAYVPHRDANGQVRGFVVLVTDVGDIKRTERALHHSQHMLAESQSAAQVGSWEAALRGDHTVDPTSLQWSAEHYRMFGWVPGSELSYSRFLDAVHPDDRAAMIATTTAGIVRGGRFENEYRIVRADGAVRVHHSVTNVVDDPNGGPMRLLGTCQDLTERRQADQEIRGTREQLQLIMDSTPAFIARFDRTRRLVWTNKSYAARFGKAPEELVGVHLREIVGEDTYPAMEPFVDRVLAGETVDFETEVPYPKLGRRFVQLAVGPTRDASGTPDGCVAVITDVTHRHELERERERALQELKEAARQKDEFLAMLSHELRNPLAPIVSAVEILRIIDPSDVEASATFRTMIERQVNFMKHMLDDLLDVSRVSQGKIELRKELLDLDGVLTRAIEVSRPLIANKQQRLAVTSTSGTVMVDADTTRLVQVFANLLNNASKYTQHGGHIAIELTMTEQEAIVSVRDNGIGMAPELLERAFDLFVQETRSLDRAQGGLGIGLTMVRSLVGMHGGSVRALSDGLGRGTEVVVRLPRAVATVPAKKEHAPVPASPRTSQSLRVLVVDDNLDAAQALGGLLEIIGHQVTLAADGATALTLVEAASPELVLIDIGLPGMDGYAVAAAMRSAGLDRAALVAVTGYGSEADKRRALEAGFDHHLVKPVELATLQRITSRPT